MNWMEVSKTIPNGNLRRYFKKQTMETIEGNKIIAEFDDGEFDGREWVFNGQQYKELKYHSSWDWLMPAIKKFNSLFEGKYFRPKPPKWYKVYEINCELIDDAVTCYEILPAFEQFVKAIQWYNLQNKQL